MPGYLQIIPQTSGSGRRRQPVEPISTELEDGSLSVFCSRSFLIQDRRPMTREIQGHTSRLPNQKQGWAKLF